MTCKQIHAFPRDCSVIPKVKPKRFFMAHSQNKTAAVIAQNTHGVCRTSCHVCSRADKHMVNITQRLLSYRNQWTGGRGSRWFLDTFFSPPFFLALATQVPLAAMQYLSGARKDIKSLPESWLKCVKGWSLNRWDNHPLRHEYHNILETNVVTRTYLWSRRIGISKLWIWHGREVPQYPEIKRDWRSPL